MLLTKVSQCGSELTKEQLNWTIFRTGCLKQFAELDTKIAFFTRLGSMNSYSYDMVQVNAAISRGEIQDLGDTATTYAQGEDYVLIGGLTSSWAKLQAGKKLTPGCYIDCY